jgi:hypothetical protein
LRSANTALTTTACLRLMGCSHIHTRRIDRRSIALRSTEARRFTSAFTASHSNDVIVRRSMVDRSASRQFGRFDMARLCVRSGQDRSRRAKLYVAGLFT